MCGLVGVCKRCRCNLAPKCCDDGLFCFLCELQLTPTWVSDPLFFVELEGCVLLCNSVKELGSGHSGRGHIIGIWVWLGSQTWKTFRSGLQFGQIVLLISKAPPNPRLKLLSHHIPHFSLHSQYPSPFVSKLW